MVHQNFFANEDGLAVARTVSAIEKGWCKVNVTDTDLIIKARVPLGVGYTHRETRPKDGVCSDNLCMNLRN